MLFHFSSKFMIALLIQTEICVFVKLCNKNVLGDEYHALLECDFLLLNGDCLYLDIIRISVTL